MTSKSGKKRRRKLAKMAFDFFNSAEGREYTKSREEAKAREKRLRKQRRAAASDLLRKALG